MMLENKYKLGQRVWFLYKDRGKDQLSCFTIRHLRFSDKSEHIPAYSQDNLNWWTEDNLYPDKQSALAELNKIKVRDLVYYLSIQFHAFKKGFVTRIAGDWIHIGEDERIKERVFKTEEELIRSLRSYE